MMLLTKAIEAQIPELGATDGQGNDAIIYAKYFTPDSNWTWYATEYNAEDRLFYGFVDGLEKEFGYFSLDELLSARGPLGLPIERDLHFCGTLGDVR